MFDSKLFRKLMISVQKQCLNFCIDSAVSKCDNLLYYLNYECSLLRIESIVVMNLGCFSPSLLVRSGILDWWIDFSLKTVEEGNKDVQIASLSMINLLVGRGNINNRFAYSISVFMRYMDNLWRKD